MIEITGKKTRLRDWKISDLAAYQSWQIGDHEWKKFDGPYYQNDSTTEILSRVQILEQKIKNADFPNPRRNLVISNLEDEFIGTASSYWISEETNWLAAGITIFNPKYWSGGIGTEALTLWIDHLFQNRPEIVRLDLQTWSGNERMMRLAEKLGFQMEGRFRKARIVNGQYYDSIQYGILRAEWEGQ